MIQNVVAALLEQSRLRDEQVGMSTSTLGMNGNEAKTDPTRTGKVDSGYFKPASSHGFFSNPTSSLSSSYKAQTQLKSRAGKDDT